jgi:hypothetical protein
MSSRGDALRIRSIRNSRWVRQSGPLIPGLAILVIACAEAPAVPPEGLPDLYAAVMADPEVEHTDADGCVRVHEIWKIQVRAVHETAGGSGRERTRALVEDVYRPFEGFWRGYLGDEGDFRRWAGRRFDLAGDPRSGIPLETDPVELIEDATARMEELTGRRGCADWFVVYGPGWANLGVVGGAGLVVDFFGMPREKGAADFRAYLPHEVNHVIDGRSGGPSAGTLLASMVGEGFASFVTVLFFGQEMSPAAALGYSAEEWVWAVEHEGEILAAVRDRLMTRDPDEIRPFRSASARPIEGGPAKIGYFVGYRIVEAYVARFGPESWLELYDLDAAEILERSGYGG